VYKTKIYKSQDGKPKSKNSLLLQTYNQKLFSQSSQKKVIFTKQTTFDTWTTASGYTTDGPAYHCGSPTRHVWAECVHERMAVKPLLGLTGCCLLSCLLPAHTPLVIGFAREGRREEDGKDTGRRELAS
jgi:hypothetical protein